MMSNHNDDLWYLMKGIVEIAEDIMNTPEAGEEINKLAKSFLHYARLSSHLESFWAGYFAQKLYSKIVAKALEEEKQTRKQGRPAGAGHVQALINFIDAGEMTAEEALADLSWAGASEKSRRDYLRAALKKRKRKPGA